MSQALRMIALMGYRGKTIEQGHARKLRAEGWTYNEISAELGVSKSSVSLWCRDIEVDEEVWSQRVRKNKNHGARKRSNTLSLRREAEIEELRRAGRDQIGRMSERDLLIAGTALYAGEGGKTPGAVTFPNSDPRMLLFFVTWLREFFSIDESRLRVRLYLHQGLDVHAATEYWSQLLNIPTSQFTKPYRAVPDPSIRKTKHPMGCPRIDYSCTRTHRRILGLVDALLSSTGSFRGGAIGSAADC